MSGPNLMRGYNNLPEASAEVFFEKDGMRCVVPRAGPPSARHPSHTIIPCPCRAVLCQ